MSIKLLRGILILTGFVVALLGINVGIGGISTLGLQGSDNFFEVTNQGVFDVRDNHVRFIGGTLIAMGGLLTYSGIRYAQARTIVPLIALLFFVGGIARISAADLGLLGGMDIAPSLLIELIGFPLLAYWVTKAASPSNDGAHL
ncbi:MAG: DUF4345 family protein [Pseudomonadota bacterium]